MNTSVDVSVIVATHCREKELQRALFSLETQKCDNFEIVIVDDNDSTEWNKKTEKIVSEFKAANPQKEITYIRNHSNKGSAKTRNIGISLAKGEYITFLDDDDIYFEEKINKQYEFMKTNDLDFSVTDIDLYFDNETFFERRTRDYIKLTDKNALLQYHFMHHITGTDTMMFKKTYIEESGMFPPIDVGDEFYLMHKAIENGGKFGYLARCDVKAYVHMGEYGLSSGKQKIDGENALFNFKKRYFCKFDKKKVRYIEARHYAVIAFTYLRMKEYLNFVKASLKAFFTSPFGCFKILKEKFGGQLKSNSEIEERK